MSMIVLSVFLIGMGIYMIIKPDVIYEVSKSGGGRKWRKRYDEPLVIDIWTIRFFGVLVIIVGIVLGIVL